MAKIIHHNVFYWFWAILILLWPIGGHCAINTPYQSDSNDEKQNVLYSFFSERPKHLDPARSYSADEAIFTGHIYEPPLQYHYLKRPYQLEPLTLTQMPAIIYRDKKGHRLADDAPADKVATTTYRFELKPNIQYQPHPALAKNAKGAYIYHDLTASQTANLHALADFEKQGTRQLKAYDYVYQIKRLADPSHHSPIASIMADAIVGFKKLRKTINAYRKQQPDDYIDLRQFDLKGAKAINDRVFEITIKGKDPQFLYWLAMPFFAPLPWEAEKFYAQPGLKAHNITLDWYPIGTGPFYLTENNPNLRMVLKKNPHYRQAYYPTTGEKEDKAKGYLKNAGKQIPFLDKIVFSLEKETIPMWNKFLQGYYDRSGISSDTFDQAIEFDKQGKIKRAESIADKNIRLRTNVQPSIHYWGFNMLDDTVGGDSERARKLRQAISIAFDVEQYISIFMNGRGIIAHDPLPPSITGDTEAFNPVVYQKNDDVERKSLAKARALLKEAGFANGINQKTGKPLVLNMDVISKGGANDRARFAWLKEQFQKLNIQLNIRATHYNRFREKVRTGQVQIFSWGWNADYPDPENFLMLLYGPNGKVKHGGENAANYHNERFDRLYDKIKDMPNGPKRQKIIKKMIAIVQKDAPWIWGIHPKSFVLSHSWYDPAKPNAMANNTLKYARIDPKERQNKRQKWNQPVFWPIVVIVVVICLLTIPVIISFWRKEHQKPEMRKDPYESNE